MDGNMSSWWSMTSRFCQQYGQQDRPSFPHQGLGFWSQMQEKNETIQGQAAEIARLKHLIQLRDNDIATLSRQENNHLNVQINILNNNISELDGLAKARENTIHKLEILLEKERRKVRKISSQNVRLKDQQGKENVINSNKHILKKTLQQDQTSKNQELNSQNSSKIKELMRTNDEMNKELKANHLKIGNLESALKLKENELKNITKDQGDLKKELYASDETLKDLKGQLKTKDDLIAELTKNSENIKNQEEKVNYDQENIDQLNTRIQELTKENFQLLKDSNASNSNKEHLESAFKLKENELKNIAKDHGELKKQLYASDETVKDLEHQLKTKDDMNAELAKNNDDIEKNEHGEISQLNTRIVQLTQENDLLRKNSKVSDIKIENLEASLTVKAKELDESMKNNTELKAVIETINVHNEELKIENETLDNKMKNSENSDNELISNLQTSVETIDGLKAKLKLKDKMLLDNTENFIKVNEKLKVSVETVQHLQNKIRMKNDLIVQLTEKVDNVEKDNQFKNKQLNSKECEINDKNSEIFQLKIDRMECRLEITELENQLNSKNKDIKAVTDNLETVNRGKRELDCKSEKQKGGVHKFSKENENELQDDSNRGQKRARPGNQDEIIVKKIKGRGSNDQSCKENYSMCDGESKTIAEFCENVKLEVRASVCIKNRLDCVRRSCDDCRLDIKDLFLMKSRELVGMSSGKPGEIMRALRTQAFLNVTGYCPD